MKKSIIPLFTVGALAVFFLTVMAEQPGAKDKGPKKGPPPDKKGWEPGKIIPPPILDILELTEDQVKKIDDLEKEVRAKLMTILTEDQLQRAREFKGKGPKGKDFDGPPDKKGKGKKDGPPKDGQTRARDDGGRPVEKIAQDLGVTPEAFREAFKKVRPAPRGELPTEAQREYNRRVLSEALGVSPEKLDAVMDKYRPEGPNDKKRKGHN